MAFLAPLATAPSVAQSSGLRAVTLGLVEAARGAQEKLKCVGPLDEGAPREVGARTRPLRKWQSSWTQPRKRRHGVRLRSVALHVSPSWVHALWLTTNEGPACTAPDDMEFHINVKIWLGLLVMKKGQCQHQRKRIRQQEPAAWLLSANTDSMHSDASSEEAERWCTVWVATPYMGPDVKQGSSRREKWSSRCSRRRSS